MLSWLRKGLHFSHVCEIIGLATRTGFEWLRLGRKNPDEEPYGSFARDVNRARAEARARLVEAAHKAAEAGDGKLSVDMLKRLDPKHWGDAATKLEVKSTGSPLGVVQFFRIALPEKIPLAEELVEEQGRHELPESEPSPGAGELGPAPAPAPALPQPKEPTT
jgi:hypothetical protein